MQYARHIGTVVWLAGTGTGALPRLRRIPSLPLPPIRREPLQSRSSPGPGSNDLQHPFSQETRPPTYLLELQKLVFSDWTTRWEPSSPSAIISHASGYIKVFISHRKCTCRCNQWMTFFFLPSYSTYDLQSMVFGWSRVSVYTHVKSVQFYACDLAQGYTVYSRGRNLQMEYVMVGILLYMRGGRARYILIQDTMKDGGQRWVD